MENLIFNSYSQYQADRIRYLLLNLVGSKIKTKNNSSDFVLDITNIFLHDLVKPSWFIDDIKTIKDVYEYADFTCNNWNHQKSLLEKNKLPLLYPKDIISEEQKLILKKMIYEVKDLDFDIRLFPSVFQKGYKGQPIGNLDINCIAKKSYEYVLSFLLEIKKRGRAKPFETSDTLPA